MAVVADPTLSSSDPRADDERFTPAGDTDPSFVAIAPGEHGPLLAEAQLRLRLLGYAVELEPTLGPQTEAALRALQEQNLLEPDGQLDYASWIVILGETGAHETSWALAAPDEALEDQAVGPLFFAEGAHRDLPGSGGYRYRQWEDGEIQILASPKGRGVGSTFYEGPIWEAIHAELGPFPPELRILDSPDEQAAGPTPTVRRGSRGPAAREVQQLLVELSFGPLTVDGVFGARSASALVVFQYSAGLDPDGVCGPATWAVLRDPPPGLTPKPLPPDPGVAVLRQQWRERLPELLAACPAESRGVIEATLRAAIDMLGCKEIPKGSNGGPEIGVITEGFATTSPAWCALAVTHWVRQGTGAGSWKALPWGNRNARALSFGRWGEREGRLQGPHEAAHPGAIFVMRRGNSGSDAASKSSAGSGWNGEGHTGLVLQDAGEHIITIDGNVDDAVRICTRKKSAILGTVRWW